MDGALIKVWERLDPDYDVSRIETRYLGGYTQAGEPYGLCRIIADARRAPGQNDALIGHRPTRETGTFGPSFPADYDILP